METLYTLEEYWDIFGLRDVESIPDDAKVLGDDGVLYIIAELVE